MKYLYSCLILILSLSANAQYPFLNVGPDDTLDCHTNCTTLHANYYHAMATATYNLTQIPYNPFTYNTGFNIGLTADDSWSDVIAIPFNFCFMGSMYNSVVIATNGMISFNESFANTACPWDLSGG